MNNFNLYQYLHLQEIMLKKKVKLIGGLEILS